MTTQSRKPNPLFIDADINVFEGQDASQRLLQKNDLRFFAANSGVVQVDSGRWQEAQRYERKTWMRRARFAVDDRNLLHKRRFNGYQAIRNMSFDRGIELGCGPFTNMRYVLESCRVGEIHLLDPLIKDYLRLPSCRYRNGRLGGISLRPSLSGLLAWRHPFQQIQHVRNAFRIGAKGRAVIIHDDPIEGFRPQDNFDLVVLINVIEHCRDVEIVFDKVSSMLSPGGVLIFHDKFLEASLLKDIVSSLYDAGHPLRIDMRIAERYLSKFDVLSRAEFHRYADFAGSKIAETALYFVGKKPR